jgi:hypothetical protein
MSEWSPILKAQFMVMIRVLRPTRTQIVGRSRRPTVSLLTLFPRHSICCKVQMARRGLNSLFKNLQASLSNHVSIKRWLS